MKVKALRDKDTKEFIYIMKMGEKFMVFTGDIPHVQPMTATMELMKEIYPLKDCEFDNYNNFELVEFDLIETGVVGADIRNKLTPYNNLMALVRLYLDETDVDKQMRLKEFIWKELKQSKKSIKYIANLL